MLTKPGGHILFDKMRKIERQVSVAQTEQMLTDGEYCVLATLCDNGYPYATPLSYVYADGNIYFHCATEGQKLRNINCHQKVSLTVVADTDLRPDKFTTKYKSVVVFGTASEIDGDEKKKALLWIIEKYSPDFLDKGKTYIEKAYDKTNIVKIEIDHMTGKASV